MLLIYIFLTTLLPCRNNTAYLSTYRLKLRLYTFSTFPFQSLILLVSYVASCLCCCYFDCFNTSFLPRSTSHITHTWIICSLILYYMGLHTPNIYHLKRKQKHTERIEQILNVLSATDLFGIILNWLKERIQQTDLWNST